MQSLLGLWFSFLKNYQWLNIIYQIINYLSNFTYPKYGRNLDIETIAPHRKQLQ